MELLNLTTADIPRAMEFVTAAGWNQTPATWSRFISFQAAGCFKANHDGQMVGTVTSTCYQRDLAWIGMMLVDPQMRRMGIGRALMKHVIAYLRDLDMQTIKLDATPMGKPLYEGLEFVVQYEFQRWRREVQSSTTVPLSTTSFEDLPTALRELDVRAFGVDRYEWLKLATADGLVYVTEEGFGMLRPGRLNDYLGPITAADFESARHIAQRLCESTKASLIWDIPKEDPRGHQLARSLGFTPLRPLARMVLGIDHTQPDLSLQWGICDPASG